MAVALSSFSESVDSVGPSIANLNEFGGRASMPWYLLEQDTGDTLEAADIQSAIRQILGCCNSAQNGSYKLSRTLPLAHPMLPYMYANSLDLRGIGRPTRQSSETSFGEVASFPNYALYANYRFDVQFATRPYAVRPDSIIPKIQMFGNGAAAPNRGWYVYPGSVGYVANTIMPYTYAPEWWRYCDFDVMPQNESVTGVRDKLKFQTKAGGAVVPNGVTFPAMPKLFMPNSILKINWYQVPLRYITSPNSVITRYRGMVNQNDWWETPNGKAYKAGELLYLSYTPKIYTSPVILGENLNGGDTTYAKFCDIQFQFLYTTRPAALDAALARDVPTPPNGNFIAAGHNLNPYFPKRQFYYTIFQSGDAANYPNWLSFPFELLFTDPDTNPAQAP